MKWIKSVVLLLLMLFTFNNILQHTTYGSSVETSIEDKFRIERKFEPWLWEKIQALKANGTMRDLSLIIRLTSDQRVNNPQIEDLKNYASSLFASSHNATVYSVLRVLPILMAKVPVAEAERIASYEFVESIGDGDRRGFIGLDVSRSAIRANDVEAILGGDGHGVRIAILDTGIDINHQDLDDLDDNPATTDPIVLDNVCFVDLNDDGVPDQGPGDDLGHGTHVAGIAAGTGQASNYQFVGVAPGAWIMNIKVAYLVWAPSGPTGTFEDDDVIIGIDYAVSHGADVISISLGVFPGGDGTNEFAKAVDDAVDQGVVVVVLAGNNGPSGQTIWTPADAFNVITVGAVDDHNTINIADDTLAERSSRGPAGGRPKPDIVAPGVNITASMSNTAALWQTYPDIRVGNFYARLDGTSMATPHVSGTVALMLQANPNLTPAQVKAILRQTARLNTNLEGLTVNDRGYGIIDALAAVQLAQNVGNIDRQYMYDSWSVETPWRHFGTAGWCVDYLKLIVDTPSSTSGVSISNVHYYFHDWFGAHFVFEHELLHQINAPHVWIDGAYYNLGNDMNTYLFSGPRIYEKGDGYVKIRALYRINNVIIEYEFNMDVQGMWLRLNYQGVSSFKTLIYIDPDVWDSTNYPYLPSTIEIIYFEGKIIDSISVNIRDTDYDDYVEIQPQSSDQPEMWILRYGYFGNSPYTALNNEDVYNRDIVIYYQGTSTITGPTGPTIYRKTESLPALKNPSFEARDYSLPGNGVYGCPPWETNNGGWRELKGDVNKDCIVFVQDIDAIGKAAGAYPGHERWNPDADLNGDGIVDIKDVTMAARDFGKHTTPIDGSYSWYTNGGGDYQMWQWLDSDAVNTVKDKQVTFTFWFLPESVAPDGSQNYARAEIVIYTPTGSQEVAGDWVHPTETKWQSAFVSAYIGAATSVMVRIHGGPDFKAWIDQTSLSILP